MFSLHRSLWCGNIESRCVYRQRTHQPHSHGGGTVNGSDQGSMRSISRGLIVGKEIPDLLLAQTCAREYLSHLTEEASVLRTSPPCLLHLRHGEKMRGIFFAGFFKRQTGGGNDITRILNLQLGANSPLPSVDRIVILSDNNSVPVSRSLFYIHLAGGGIVFYAHHIRSVVTEVCGL